MKAQWIKKERELEQEKENVRKQAALFKQVHMHTALKLLPLFFSLTCSLALYSNCQCLFFFTVNLENFQCEGMSSSRHCKGWDRRQMMQGR